MKKNYSVSADVLLSIENQFGQVHVENWPEYRLDITAQAKTEGQAVDLLERIDVKITDSGNKVSFETRFTGLHQNGGQDGYEVNYYVRMNPKNPLRIANKFGDIYLDDRDNETEVALEYGSLKAQYMGGDFDLDVSFGGAAIMRVEKGRLSVNYSDLSVGSAGELEVGMKFSQVAIEEVATMILEAKYGSVELRVLKHGIIESHFSGFNLERLEQYLVFEGNYVRDFKIEKLSKDFDVLDISGQYSSYEVTIEAGLGVALEAEFSYADLGWKGVDVQFDHKDEEGSKKDYRGRKNGGEKDR